MDYPDYLIDYAREYVKAIERCESTGKKVHDEKRQLAHDDFMHALKRAGHDINPYSYDDRGNATNLAYKIVRWLGR